MIDLHVVTFAVIFGGLVGAILWDLITWCPACQRARHTRLSGTGTAVARPVLRHRFRRMDQDDHLHRLVSADWLCRGSGADDAIFWISRTAPSRVDRWFRRRNCRRHFQPESRSQRCAKRWASSRGAVRGRLHPDVLHPVLGRADGARRDQPRDLAGAGASSHDGIEI